MLTGLHVYVTFNYICNLLTDNFLFAMIIYLSMDAYELTELKFYLRFKDENSPNSPSFVNAIE